MATESKVTGLRFNRAEEGFFGNLLLRELGKREPRIGLQDDFSGDPEILILNLDTVMAPDFLASHRMPASAYKVFLVHDLNRGNMVYLKQADLIVYSSPFQRRVVEELLGLEYESAVIPFPSLASGNAGLLEGFAAIGETYAPASGAFVEEVLQTFYRWFRLANVRVIHLCMDVPRECLDDLESRIQDFEDSRFVEVRLVNRRGAGLEAILDIAGRCACGEYFRREISEEQFDGLMKSESFTLLYDRIASDPLISSLARMGWMRHNLYPGISTHFLGRSGEIPDLDSYCAGLMERIDAGFPGRRSTGRKNHPMDTLESLQIIHGRPLANRYVFSICFRNQAGKLPRCIRSIISQNKSLDFGIVFVDDGSGDGSSEIILEECRGRIEDFVIVKNAERKYASRNFHNVIHLLTRNPDSVLVEVDGDDFLAGPHVLDVLEGYYAKGCLKTIGSHELFPESQNFATRESHQWTHENVDIGKPWSITACNAWLHLRSTKVSLLRAVEIDHFLDRNGKQWLKERHDSAIHPRAIELSLGKTAFIKEVLYMYDVSGGNHDHGNGFDEIKLFKSIDRFHGPFTLA